MYMQHYLKKTGSWREEGATHEDVYGCKCVCVCVCVSVDISEVDLSIPIVHSSLPL